MNEYKTESGELYKTQSTCYTYSIKDLYSSKIYRGKGHPRTDHKGPEGEESCSNTLSLASALDGGGWSTARPGRFTPVKDPVPTVQKAGWISGPVWTGEENRAPPGFDAPDRPPRSKPLYRLRFSEIQNENKVLIMINLVTRSAMIHNLIARLFISIVNALTQMNLH